MLPTIRWTDVLQAAVMFVALFALAICGVIEVGGFAEAWKKSEDAARINFFK